MAGFYNPLSPQIQWGQGISDLNAQIQQMLLLQKMFNVKGQGQSSPQPQGPNPDLTAQILRAFSLAPQMSSQVYNSPYGGAVNFGLGQPMGNSLFSQGFNPMMMGYGT